MPEPLQNTEVKCADWDWLPEKSLSRQVQDASVFYVRDSNGRISPLVRLWFIALLLVRKVTGEKETVCQLGAGFRAELAGASKRLSLSFPGCTAPKRAWPTRAHDARLPALVSAAEAHFGSWGKALYAAGIDPNLYFVHHTWRKPAGV
jgi:hypothetical protein